MECKFSDARILAALALIAGQVDQTYAKADSIDQTTRGHLDSWEDWVSGPWARRRPV